MAEWTNADIFFQNKSGRVSHKELHDIMMTLLKMENISETEADELAPILQNFLSANKLERFMRKHLLLVLSQIYY